jgi:hypothetical protein
MLASRENATGEKIGLFECARCDLVVEYPEHDFKSKDPPLPPPVAHSRLRRRAVG